MTAPLKLKCNNLLCTVEYLILNYTTLVYSSSCVFYNETSGLFSSDGCHVGSCSSPLATQCLCTHLTSFSNSFTMPKMRVHIDPLGTSGAGGSISGAEAFSLTSLNQNPVALAFCIGCICVYLICILITIRFDSWDKNEVYILYILVSKVF